MPDKEKAINLAPGKDIRDFKRKNEIPDNELTREQLNFKRATIHEHLVQLHECLHYAEQDLAQFVLSLTIDNPEKRKETQRAVDDMKKEIEFYKEKLSKLNAI
jgi:hypothetical protein